MGWKDSRFNPTALLRGHAKGLSDYRDEGRPLPASGTRWTMRGLAIASGAAIGIFDAPLNSAGPMLAAVALMAGGLLTAFTHLSTLRKSYTDRSATWDQADRMDRDFLDETAAHLLTGSYVAAWCAAALVVGMNFSAGGQPRGWFAAVPVALATYLFLIFIVAIPRLYYAYVHLNSVRSELSGTHRD